MPSPANPTPSNDPKSEITSLSELAPPQALDKDLGKIVSLMQAFSDKSEELGRDTLRAFARRKFPQINGAALTIGKDEYVIDGFVGSGAKGLVVHATSDAGAVAIKFTEPFPTTAEKQRGSRASDSIEANFEQELRALARFASAGVEGVPHLRGQAVIRQPGTGMSVGVTAMDLLPGKEFSEELGVMLSDRNRHPEVFAIVSRAFAIAAAAAEQRIVLEDMAPTNLLINRTGAGVEVSVVDFGNSTSYPTVAEAREESVRAIGELWEQEIEAWNHMSQAKGDPTIAAASDAIADAVFALVDGEMSLQEAADAVAALARES